jgi:hypothetical protein
MAVLALSVARPGEPQVRAAALGAFEARFVDFARQGAIARLRTPACQALLTDFKDAQGRTLRENLEAFGVAADGYLAMIPFLDGSHLPLCQAGRSQLLTNQGAPRVFVCKPFVATIQKQRVVAEVYVIHEMLHTLGLGENPPTSQEITQQVIRRCAP